MAQASFADWVLRAATLAFAVATAVRRPEALVFVVPLSALALLINWVRPTPRHRVTGILVLLFGVLLLATETDST